MLKENYTKKRILLCGFGFIGSNFYKMFKDKYDITILDKFNYPCTLENGLWDELIDNEIIRHDIAKAEIPLIKNTLPDYIINMAADSHVDVSLHENKSFFYTNTIGVENILKAIGDKPIRLVHFSTDEVYGDLDINTNYEFLETDILKPNSPYSASKAAADMIINAYYRTYKTDIVTVRPTNNYGPYQYPEKLMPFIIKRIAEGKTIPIYGDGESIREWLYVDDCCRAVELVMLNGKSGEIYNIGGGRDNRMSNKFIAAELNNNNNNFEYIKDRPGHDRKYAVNSDKIKMLGWIPEINLINGLKLTKEWYMQRLDIIKNLHANPHIK